MKHIALALFALSFTASYAVNIKPITQVNDINKVGEEYYSKPVSWFQGDSIKFDVYARDVRTPIDFTGQTFPVLFVTAETNRQLVYMAQTGSVVNATNGHVSVTVQASGATLGTNQNYSAWMIVFRESGGATAEVATVAYSQAQVLPSPLGVTYTNVEPITNFYIDVGGIVSEFDPVFTASVAYAITSSMTSQWTQAYNWGDASTQNLGKGWSQYPATQNVNFAEYYATNTGGVDFDLSPSGAVQPARMQWDPNIETLRLGLDALVSLDVGQQQVALVRNAESATISNGTVVYISGATGDKASVKIASYSNDTLSARTIGIAAEDITAGGLGFVVTRGPVYQQDTSAFTAGAMLYLGANGNVITNRPQAPLHGVFIGVVEKVNANAGIIYVAVQNGFEMDELHDVNVSGVSSGQILQYNGTVWTNANAAYLPLAGGTMTGPITNSVSTSEFITSLFMQNANGGIRQTIRAGSSTNNPRAEFVASLVGVGDAHFGLDPDSIYIGRQDTSYPTTNALVRIDRVTGVTYFKQQPVIPGYLTTALAASTYATGAPLYEVDLSPYATGTPIYSVAGLATGTPLYAYTETDPVWVAERSNYATGTPIYSVAGLATGTPLYEVDLSPYATGTPIYSVAGLATGTPLYAESDPVWAASSNLYATTAGVATITAAFMSGSEISNTFQLAGNYAVNGQNITGKWFNVDSINNGIDSFIGGGISNTIIHAPYSAILSGINNKLFTNAFYSIIAGGNANTINSNGQFSAILGGELNKIQKSVTASYIASGFENEILDGSSFASVLGGYKNKAGMYALAAGNQANATNEGSFVWSGDYPLGSGMNSLGDYTFNVRSVGGTHFLTPFIRLYDTNQVQWGVLTPTGGVQIGANSFYIRPSGDISQDATNTAALGIVTAQTVTASFFGNGAGITNLTLTGYGLATGTPLYAYTETDPIWSSASNLYLTTASASSIYATGTPLYAYTETDPIWTASSSLYYTAAQADALFATGSPVYDISGLATGTPLYAYTETDPIWTSASSLYYTITAADAKFATGTPIYSISGKLDSNTWAAADSTTNYASRIIFNATSNAFDGRITAVEGYTNRAASALASSVWAAASSTTNAAPLDAYVAFTTAYAIAQSTTNSAPLDAWTTFTSSYATADSTTNYASRVDFVAFTNTYSIGDWSSFAATQTVNLGQQNLTNAASITRATNSIDFNAGTLGGTWTFNNQPSIPGYLTTNGNASGLTAFPSSLLTVSAGNTNYLRHTTANPTNATYPGQWNQFTYTYRDATSIIMKVYGPSNKWYGIVLNELPIE